jgi:hypothetical protein
MAATRGPDHRLAILSSAMACSAGSPWAGAEGSQFRAISFYQQFRVISHHSACRAAPQNGTFSAGSCWSPARSHIPATSLVCRECGRDRVFVQCHFGPSGPIRYGRTSRPRDQRGLPMPRMQRRLRALCAYDPTHHGRGPRGADDRSSSKPEHLRGVGAALCVFSASAHGGARRRCGKRSGPGNAVIRLLQASYCPD